jgi:hypothetical protein
MRQVSKEAAMQRQLSVLSVSDEVAILPADAIDDLDAIEIQKIVMIGQSYLQLENGWVYTSRDGRGIGHSRATKIVPAERGHYEMLGRFSPRRVAGG